MSVIKDTQAERLELLELIAYWEGRVNSTLLTRHFGLSRQQASGILSRYNTLAPGNLYYSSSAKAYLASETFAPLYISTDATDYLNWLNTGHLSGPHPRLPHEGLQLPPRQVSVAVMRGLIIAIREQRRLEVDYVSLSNPNREGRIIAPHTFVKTGLRWHLRAWCEKSKNYRDFVLSRFRGTPQLLDKTAHTGEQDAAWHTEVTVVLQPDPRLSAAKRQVLEEDYQMHQSKLHITTRACLVQYLLIRCRVGSSETRETRFATLVLIRCRIGNTETNIFYIVHNTNVNVGISKRGLFEIYQCMRVVVDVPENKYFLHF